MNQLKGLDVSNNNGHIDWAKVKSSGYPWAYAKATQGATFFDPYFAANYKGMKDNDILPGAYHFASFATSSPKAEAQAYLKAVLENGGFILPPMLDIEVSGGRSARQIQSDAREWWSVIKSHWNGRGKPFLYSSASFINEFGLYALTDIFELWIADYGPSQPPQGAKIWQYTETGHVNGISGNADLDIFYGTIEDLRAMSQKHA